MPNPRLLARVSAARPLHTRIGLGQAQPVHPASGLAGNRPATPGVHAPKAPAAISPPWETDPLYASGAGEALQTLQDKTAGLNAGWQYKQEQYGLGQYANNPYSQAALLGRKHEAARKGIVNTSGLNLYSGNTVNHLAGADRNYDINLKNLEAREAAEEAQYTSEQQAAQDAYDEAIGNFKTEALERAAKTEPAAAPKAGHGKKSKGGKGHK